MDNAQGAERYLGIYRQGDTRWAGYAQPDGRVKVVAIDSPTGLTEVIAAEKWNRAGEPRYRTHV